MSQMKNAVSFKREPTVSMKLVEYAPWFSYKNFNFPLIVITARNIAKVDKVTNFSVRLKVSCKGFASWSHMKEQ